jgi:putative SOS response-associated peptidase YedK
LDSKGELLNRFHIIYSIAMCSNYLPAPKAKITKHFGVVPPDNEFKPEAYPGYLAPIIRLNHDKPEELECVPACFGMVPAWADLKLSKHTYNARTETVGSKPSFRHAYQKRQFAIIPADAIYEPNYETGKAVRWKISLGNDAPLGIAGIWEYRSNGPDGQPLISFSMLTINADDHPLMQRFHKPEDEKRMVVILRPDEYESWLHAPGEQITSFLTQFPADELVAREAPKPSAKKAAKPTPSSASLF